MRYAYPAVFRKSEDGGYEVSFPDIEGCLTCGDDLPESISMAEDALALMLYEIEEEGKEIPTPSKRHDIKTEEGEFVSYVLADTMAYRKRFNQKAVKKTLTIPEWMNEEAMARNLNFSQILQDALAEKLAV